MTSGLHMLVSYTWSHSIDDLSSDQKYTFPNGEPRSGQFDPRKKGSSDFDVRHALNGSVIADLPSPVTGIKGLIFRHWSADAISFMRTAVPSGLFADNFVHRPDLVPGQPLYLYGPEFPGGKSFNRSAFVLPPPGRDGNLGRNVLRGLGAWQIDVGIHREFLITEKLHFQFRVEAFNVFNHPNFANPSNPNNSSVSILTLSPAPQFGAVTQMLNNGLSPLGILGQLSPLFQIGGPRTMQFALRFRF
jgi:hypothetical protein